MPSIVYYSQEVFKWAILQLEPPESFALQTVQEVVYYSKELVATYYNLELRELFYFILFLVFVNKMYLRQLRLIESS
jgi:hypothetical protein